MDEKDEAIALIAQHGRKAQQIVIDQIVSAIRAGDDITAGRRGDLLRAIDKLVLRQFSTTISAPTAIGGRRCGFE